MDEGIIKQLAKDLAAEIIAQGAAPGGHACQCPVGNDRHYRHHELMDEIVDFFARFKDMRWGVAKLLAGALVFCCLGIFGLGLVLKLRAWLGLSA